MRIIFLIMIGISIIDAHTIKIKKSAASSVLKLEWTKNIVGKDTNWSDAIKRCENLVLLGHSDWRLPNVYELRGVVDSIKDSYLKENGVEDTRTHTYWSCDTFEGYEGKAGSMYSGDGYSNAYDKRLDFSVRCVRNLK